MTLKEKFDIISCNDCNMPYCDIKCTTLSDWELNKLEQIADEFAIEFLIWASQFALQRFDENRWQVLGLADFGFTKTVSTEEILEQFKKEKEL